MYVAVKNLGQTAVNWLNSYIWFWNIDQSPLEQGRPTGVSRDTVSLRLLSGVSLLSYHFTRNALFVFSI